MAVSSEERAYKNTEKHPEFQEIIKSLVLQRALELCHFHRFVGLATEPKVVDLYSRKPLKALSLDYEEIPDDLDFARVPQWKTLTPGLYRMSRPWKFGNQGFKKTGTSLVAVGSAILLPSMVLGMECFPILVAGMSGSLACTMTGSFLYDWSVPISFEHALERAKKGKQVNHLHSWFRKKVPHLVFEEIRCTKDAESVWHPTENVIRNAGE